MKIGDKVKVKVPYGIDGNLGLEGTIVTIGAPWGYDFGVDFGVINNYHNNLNGILPRHTGRAFYRNEIELATKEIITSREDFYILLDTHVKPFELEALFDWARIHGYSFCKHSGLELHQAGKGTYDFINFHHVRGGNTIYGEKRDSFSVDNNSQGIKLSYKIEDIINKKEENMNEEIEKALKEGDMSMALFNNNVTNLDPPNQSEVKSSLGGLKKRTKKVKFVTRLI